MKGSEKQRVIDYLENEIGFRFLYGKEAVRVKNYVLAEFVGIKEGFEEFFDFDLFNAWMDDNFRYGKYRCDLRFKRYVDYRKTLPDGSKNPNYRKPFWRLG